ncbi:glucose-1-phosphate adenylyltransferase [Shewanella litorisediminis]|uniref:Glucose-1-phosphate adenylyltransferase n=1 Tax=Shewanella litorisediminis TaxID=1173586 RepID=A0ABX7G086_9GAMM|nr:glucose-1-phosphate adenylyltransferase [Shewanella litorisediminis]MCL2918211.1 glucose-1-phosphate adenylyltransferase [Shewanella litorisediminis]QRH00736.1 glucose-1-phosphate adenylyltransferase [Shewanella litorisediminis]
MPNHSPRFISNLTRETYALILAGGRGSRLFELTDWRAKPALYFGGKFRVIDFPLSNCINSGIRRIGVVTQYQSHSLIRHVMRGWGHFKRELGESVEILPASQRYSESWYQGTADAVFQNIDIIRHELPRYVMILSGDHVYRMDYAGMLAAHAQSGADMTVCCQEVPVAEAAGSFGVMEVAEDMRVVGFEEKPANPSCLPHDPERCLASMGNYVFNTEFLFDQLRKDAENASSERDFGKDIIPSIIREHKVFAYAFKSGLGAGQDYWRDVGTLDAFWQANMELLSPEPHLNLYDAKWPIWTYQEQLPPAKFVFDDEDRRGCATDSIVSGGCIISGARVKRSVLFNEVRICSYSEVEGAVILPDVVVLRNCRLRNVIIDRGCVIPEGMVIGHNHDHDRARGFRVTDKGAVLITREMLGLPVGFE